MTSWVVADSGILLATVLPELTREKAQGIWRYWTIHEFQIAVPVLFRYEITAVIRKHVHRGTLSVEEGIRCRDLLLTESVHPFVTDDLLKRGYDLASELGRPTAYDTQYLALAEHLACEFWTADQRLFNVASPSLPWIKWIGDFSYSEGD